MIVLKTEEIARVYRGFRAGLDGDVDTVRRWIGAVLYGGNWRFRDPESVCQEVLLHLIEIARADRVRDPGSFRKFVYSVAKNTCVAVYHRERKRSELEREAPDNEIPAPSNPEQAIEARERLEAMSYILQRLPRSCRELWDLVYRERETAEEVGKRLGITANNVRVRVHRCLARAREIYEELVRWPESAEGRRAR